MTCAAPAAGGLLDRPGVRRRDGERLLDHDVHAAGRRRLDDGEMIEGVRERRDRLRLRAIEQRSEVREHPRSIERVLGAELLEQRRVGFVDADEIDVRTAGDAAHEAVHVAVHEPGDGEFQRAAGGLRGGARRLLGTGQQDGNSQSECDDGDGAGCRSAHRHTIPQGGWCGWSGLVRLERLVRLVRLEPLHHLRAGLLACSAKACAILNASVFVGTSISVGTRPVSMRSARDRFRAMFSMMS